MDRFARFSNPLGLPVAVGVEFRYDLIYSSIQTDRSFDMSHGQSGSALFPSGETEGGSRVFDEPVSIACTDDRDSGPRTYQLTSQAE